jgi:hypothetical protein
MTRILARLVIDGPPDNPGNWVKLFYRAGTTYSRVETAPGFGVPITLLHIAHEPDLWLINPDKGSGTHVKDHGPTFAIHLPIFPSGGGSELDRLEFGRESDWFLSVQSSPAKPSSIDGKMCDGKIAEVQGTHVTLYTDPRNSTPVQLEVGRAGRKFFTINYINYQVDLPFDPAVFVPPPGIAIVD